MLQILLPVRKVMMQLSLLEHLGLPWAWLMQLKQLTSLAAPVAKNGANHRSPAPSCNPAHLTRSNAGAPAQLRKGASTAVLRNMLLSLSRCIGCSH